VYAAADFRDGTEHETDLHHGVPGERRLSLMAGDRRFVQPSSAITVRATDLQGCVPLDHRGELRLSIDPDASRVPRA
jgi:hypothetical protein